MTIQYGRKVDALPHEGAARLRVDHTIESVGFAALAMSRQHKHPLTSLFIVRPGIHICSPTSLWTFAVAVSDYGAETQLVFRRGDERTDHRMLLRSIA